MNKVVSGLPFIALNHDETANSPIYQQIYDSMRRAILSGECRPKTKLLSTRDLARQLGISRTTVVNAYDQLFAEGYLEAKTGAGTFVARTLPEEFAEIESGGVTQLDQFADPPQTNLSECGKRLLDSHARKTFSRFNGNGSYAFQNGLPALDKFPFEIWARLAARRWRSPQRELLAYGSAAGLRPLRETIAGYLKTARAVNCDPEQVIIVAGAQQGLDLAARVLLNPGDEVWTEDPFYHGAHGALVAAGAEIYGVPVDQEGFNLDTALKMNQRAKLVYVTPSHQFPLGMTMSLRRRLALLDWARQAGAWIIEDDYDSEYRYEGRPLASLQGLDRAERTIYIGTFSKTVFPSLRLGCLVVPKSLIEVFVAARLLSDLHSSLVDQAILNDFIAEGHFARHVRRMRSLYKERQEILLREAKRELAGLIEVSPDPAGMHLIGWLPDNVCDREIAQKAARRGVETAPLSDYSARNLPRGGLILGYAAVGEKEIKDGVKKLAQALSQ